METRLIKTLRLLAEAGGVGKDDNVLRDQLLAVFCSAIYM